MLTVFALVGNSPTSSLVILPLEDSQSPSREIQWPARVVNDLDKGENVGLHLFLGKVGQYSTGRAFPCFFFEFAQDQGRESTRSREWKNAGLVRKSLEFKNAIFKVGLPRSNCS